MDPKQRWDASESAGTNPGRHACEAESAYGIHVKECINEWNGPLQRVPKLRGGDKGFRIREFLRQCVGRHLNRTCGELLKGTVHPKTKSVIMFNLERYLQ